MSTDSPTDISEYPDEIRKALVEYEEGFIQKSDFILKVGGLENAERILKLTNSDLHYFDDWESAFEPDSALNSDLGEVPPTDSGRTLLGRPLPSIPRREKSSNRQKNVERVSVQAPQGVARNFMAIAFILILVIMLGLSLSDIFSELGILLLSVSVGSHLLSLFWLEILTLPRFKNRKEFGWNWWVWLNLLGISILSSIFIIAVDFLPSTSSNDFSILFNYVDELGGKNTFHPFIKTALLFQITSNIFLILSMKNVTNFRNELIKSPWTIASLISLFSVISVIISIEDTYDLTLTEDLTLINFSAIIISSSAMIYGRSANSNFSMAVSLSLITPSILGYLILYQQGDGVGISDSIFTMYIIAPLLLNFITWIAPSNVIKINSKDSQTQDIKFMKSNAIILIFLVICIVYLSSLSNRMYLTLIPLLFSYAIFSREHKTRVGGSTLKINRIVDRNTKDGNIANKKIKLKFSILGATETGKTSFTASLWTLLKTRELRRIWWSPTISINDHKVLIDHIDLSNGKNLKDLAKRGGYESGKSTDVENMLEDRSAAQSCEDWISERSFPTPSKNSPFPFTVESFGESEQKLNNLSKLLVDPENRALPETTTTPGKITMSMNFHADAEIIHPSFLFGRNLINKDKREIFEIGLDIETWDINGETFSAAIYHTRDFVNSDSQRSSQLIMKPITQSELNDSGHGGAKAADVEDATKLFLHSSHTFLIVDTEDLLYHRDTKGVEQYLKLLRTMHRKGEGRLERLQILLNKADELLGNNDEYGLDAWSDMNDRNKSEAVINDATNSAFDELRASGMDVGVGFTCTFGGLVTENKGTPQERFIAPYPMIPVNVLEPFIDVILGSNLTFDDV